jgi:two-component system chemotaxis response regulator CheY
MTIPEKVLGLPHHVSIMVIEDDAMVRSIIVEYLQAFGFSRIKAPASSSEAVMALIDEKISYDLVLSDWQMPDVSGLELLKMSRKLWHLRKVKFIMITSQVPEEKEKIAKALALGVDGYILKPFKGKTLHAKIWEVLGWDHATSA